MKKIINILTFCIAASVAALCISCSSPSSSGSNPGNIPGGGLPSEDDRYYYQDQNVDPYQNIGKAYFTSETFSNGTKDGIIFFYIGKNAASRNDEISIKIYENPNNIKITTECVWIENDTDGKIQKLIDIPNYSGREYWVGINKFPNGYVKFSADKEGTFKYRLTNKNRNWYIPTDPEVLAASLHTVTIVDTSKL